jgi:surfeit locus 1 family protein
MLPVPTGSGRLRRSRWPRWFVAACLVLLLVFLALGTWQVQRRSWKLALMARVTDRVQSAALPLPAPEQWPGMNATNSEYQAVLFQGHWLSDKTVLTQAVTRFGTGYWVLTPLQRLDGSQVLVNRGFIPMAAREAWSATAAQAFDARAPGEVSVEGLVRMSEPGGGFLRRNDPFHQRWYSRDVAALAQAMGLTHAAPFFVDAGRPSAQVSDADLEASVLPATQEGPRAGMTVIHFPNNHLVYALTWYGLALLLAGALLSVARYAPSQAADTPSEP